MPTRITPLIDNPVDSAVPATWTESEDSSAESKDSGAESNDEDSLPDRIVPESEDPDAKMDVLSEMVTRAVRKVGWAPQDVYGFLTSGMFLWSCSRGKALMIPQAITTMT